MLTAATSTAGWYSRTGEVARTLAAIDGIAQRTKSSDWYSAVKISTDVNDGFSALIAIG
jgi:hypothetical protein